MSHQGRIKFYSPTRQYGFCIDVDTDKEFFFVRGSFNGPLHKGDDVLFDIVMGKKGPRAVNIIVQERYGRD